MRDTRVLIIDDDPEVRDGAKASLARPGFEFEVAADGRSGLAKARRRHPDILICDVDMPGGLNGFQVLEALRKEPAMADISIMMLTRHASRASVRLGMTLGADDYLTKPFTPSELVAAFDQLLSKRGRAGQVLETVVRRHRWQTRVAYAVAGVSLATAGVSLYLWRGATQDLEVAQHQLDRAATVADGKLPQLLGGARKSLREVVAAAPLPTTPDGCRDLIAKLAHTVPPSGEVGWVGANGIITCRTGAQEAGQSVGSRPFFVRARDTGGFAAGDYSIDAPSGVPVLTSAMPIKDASGAFAGVAFVSQDIRPSAQPWDGPDGDAAHKDGPAPVADAAAGAAKADPQAREPEPGGPLMAAAYTPPGAASGNGAGGSQSPEKLDLSLNNNLARQYLILFGVLTGASLGVAGWAAGTFAKWGKLMWKIFGR